MKLELEITVTNLPKLIDEYLKKKEFVFKDGKLYNSQNQIIIDPLENKTIQNNNTYTTNIEL